MSENRSGKELIEEALNLVLGGGDDKLALAIIKLKKARDMHNFSSDYSKVHVELYIRFIEKILGLNSTNEKISKYFIEGLTDTTYLRNGQTWDEVNLDRLESDGKKIRNLTIASGKRDFLENDMVENWLKSLKYDALVRQIKDWEDEDKAYKEKLNKVKEIIGE
ncbi:hypothetical protein [Lunatibacter salilacus]|uniref:hypothetical protein n=1 Tax=Lunatibacter salilacus TaxID=2483804 RepID=UPI00131E5008|nr:hypothetical protein [Lunatibacter salilacus]